MYFHVFVPQCTGATVVPEAGAQNNVQLFQALCTPFEFQKHAEERLPVGFCFFIFSCSIFSFPFFRWGAANGVPICSVSAAFKNQFSFSGAARQEWRDMVKSTSRPVPGVDRDDAASYPSLLDTLKAVLPAIPWYLVPNNTNPSSAVDQPTPSGTVAHEQPGGDPPPPIETDGDGPTDEAERGPEAAPGGEGGRAGGDDSGNAGVQVARRAVGRVDVVVCGIRPPLEMPIAWLHAKLHAPDYFLYIVVIRD